MLRQGQGLILILISTLLLVTSALCQAEPLEMEVSPPQDGAVSPAPIHGSSLEARLVFQAPWPGDNGRPRPEILEKSLWVHWNSQRHTAKDHPLPELFARLKLALPAGAGISGRLSRAITPEHVAALNRDVATLELPLTKLQGNRFEFFLRLADSTPIEVTLLYDLHLTETVAGIHPDCRRYGISMKELSSLTARDKAPGFLFVSCAREDRAIYVNIAKPDDLVFTASGEHDAARESIVVSDRPETRSRHELLTELALTTPGGHGPIGSRYELSFDSSGPSGFRLSLGFAPAYLIYSDDNPTGPGLLHQLSLMALLQAAYQFPPGHWELGADFKGSLASFMLSAAPSPSAQIYDGDVSLGCLLALGRREHVFGFHLGWYGYGMDVKRNSYGMQAQGVNLLTGPQLALDMRYAPLGRMGWTGYFKYAPLSNSIDFGNFSSHSIIIGAAVDLPILADHDRRPSVFVEGGFVGYTLNNVDVTDNHGLVGILFPIW